jgi:hypothetical protein
MHVHMNFLKNVRVSELRFDICCNKHIRKAVMKVLVGTGVSREGTS